MQTREQYDNNWTKQSITFEKKMTHDWWQWLWLIIMLINMYAMASKEHHNKYIIHYDSEIRKSYNKSIIALPLVGQ